MGSIVPAGVVDCPLQTLCGKDNKRSRVICRPCLLWSSRRPISANPGRNSNWQVTHANNG